MNLAQALRVILLLILINLTLSDFCQNSFHGSYSPCTFKYGYQDQNCTNFIFYNCTWDECITYQTAGNDTVCTQYQTFNDSAWSPCMSRCCDSSKSYDYSSGSFSQCDDDKKSAYIKALIISIAIFVGVLIIIIIICCYCKDRINLRGCFSSICQLLGKIGRCLIYLITCKCCRKEPEQNAGEDYRNKQIQLAEIKKWSREQIQNQALFQTCCICLEPGPTLQLQCRHVNHRICIIAWIKKKQECPLCRVSNFTRVKVYCQKCLQQHFEVNLLAHKGQVQSAMQICNNCK